MRKPSRPLRTATAASLVLALGLSLSACGGGDSGGGGSDGVTLRFSWWGSDPRHKATQKVIEAFEKENPNISIEGEYADFSGYWDKLATQTAAGNPPDVITMDEKYLQEYAGRGALANLNTLEGLNLSKFPEAALELGRYEDGLYGLSTGQNALTVVANGDLFAQAGVELPDDSSWTWEEYYDLSAELAENLPKASGSDYGNSPDGSLRVWLRQHGESLYSDSGDAVGYSNETAASFFENLLHVRDEAGGARAAAWVEGQSGSFEASSFASNKTAMSWYWSNQLPVLKTTTDSDIKMLRAPSSTGKAADNGMYYKASMYWTVSSQSEHPEAATKFVNFLANNKKAANHMLVDRGVPANPDMVKAIKPKLGEADQFVVEFLNNIEPELSQGPKPSPVGASGVQDVIVRYYSDVLFGNLPPDQAAKEMTVEIERMIGG